jgi:peptide/nickel transport system substrate-binding protein/microcin C transport system substrate-binding protein
MTLAFASFATAAVPPMKITPLGKPDAPVDGTFYRCIGAEPENFSPLAGGEYASRQVYEYAVEGLLWINPETYDFEPQLAESYEVSKDFLTFTFKINKNAKFSDGKPVTSEDVKFSVEAVRDPAYQASQRVPYYEDVESIETPDPHTVIFKMKKKYFKNLEVIATSGFTPVLPKHIYGDPKKKWDVSPIFGSGPYKVQTYNRGKNIILVRDENWWGKDQPNLKSMGKFKSIQFRFIKEENLEIEMVKKGDIDYMWPIQIENYEKKAVGEPFGSKIKKIQAENKIPKRYGFIGWNQKNPIFKNKETRMALSHLFNRKMLIEKFMYDKAVEGRAPVYYKSPFLPADVKPIEFNAEKAKAMLKKDGWADNDKNGVLEKTIDGATKEFRFALLLPNRDVEKYFTMYKEDLKKAGIDMEIKLIEWNTFSKLLDEQKFDAVTLAWAGGSPEDDLKQIWHSDSARMGGSNFISYSNKEVDKYIDQARAEMNKDKRKQMWQKAVRLIAQDAPYTYLFNLKYDLFLLNSRIGFDKPTYTYDFSHTHWFLAK